MSSYSFCWENSGNRTISATHKGGWKMFFGPWLNNIYNEVLLEIEEFESQYKNCWVFLIGVCTKKHEVLCHVGGSEYGWSMANTGAKCHNSANGKPFSPKGFDTGDRIIVKYSKKDQTLSFFLNGTDLGISHRNVAGPVRVCFSICLASVKVKVTPLFKFPDINSELLKNEENERLDYISEEFGDIEVVLRNKNLRLWKVYLYYSSYSSKFKKYLISSDQKNIVFEKMKHLSFNVEENAILKIILSKSVDEVFPNFFHQKDEKKSGSERSFCVNKDPNFLDLVSLLIDYFLFFKNLEMKEEMFYILETTDHFTIEENVIIFRELLSSIERKNEVSNKLFFSSAEKEEEGETDIFSIFTHSFTLYVFRRLINLMTTLNIKLFLGEWEEQTQRMKTGIKDSQNLHFLRVILLNYLSSSSSKEADLCVFEETVDVYSLDHPDYFRYAKRNGMGRKLENLYREKKLTNLSLKPSDDENNFLKCHREVVIWKSNFFYKTVTFGGLESETFSESGEILLYDIKKEEMESFLELMYLGELKEKKKEEDETSYEYLKKLFLILYMSEKFQEMMYVEKMLKEIIQFLRKNEVESEKRKKGKNMKKEDENVVEKLLLEYGYLVAENEILKSFVVPILKLSLEEKRIRKLMVLSNKKWKKQRKKLRK